MFRQEVKISSLFTDELFTAKVCAKIKVGQKCGMFYIFLFVFIDEEYKEREKMCDSENV